MLKPLVISYDGLDNWGAASRSVLGAAICAAPRKLRIQLLTRINSIFYIVGFGSHQFFLHSDLLWLFRALRPGEHLVFI